MPNDQNKSTMTPKHTNPRDRDEIDYRFGTHGSILNRMLDRLDEKEHPGPTTDESDVPLRELKTRRRDDPTVAFLDAWATVADVLTFYQERIANEVYLRTADEKQSLTQLARMIGYRPAPGVAAGCFLSFFLDDTEQAPDQVTIPAGNSVQSVPEGDELPRTFETERDLNARPEWNTLHPLTERPQYLAMDASEPEGKSSLYLIDTDGTLNTNETITVRDLRYVGPTPFTLTIESNGAEEVTKNDEVYAQKVDTLYLDGIRSQLKQGDPLLVVADVPERSANKPSEEESASERSGRTKVFEIGRITLNEEKKRTAVEVEQTESSIIYLLAELFTSLFGSSGRGSNDDENNNRNEDSTSPRNPEVVLNPHAPDFLDSIKAIGNRKNLITAGQVTEELLRQHDVGPDEIKAQAEHIPNSGDRGVFAFRQKVGFFGSNAPGYLALSASYGDDRPNPFTDSNENHENWDEKNITIWEAYQVEGNKSSTQVQYPFYINEKGSHVLLERNVDAVEKNSWVLFTEPNNETSPQAFRVDQAAKQSVTGFSLNASVTGLKLSHPFKTLNDFNGDKSSAGKSPTFNDTPLKFPFRTSTAHVESERLDLARQPMSETIGTPGASTGTSLVSLDDIRLGLTEERPVLVSGTTNTGIENVEVATIDKRIDILGSHSILKFTEPLNKVYKRSTVKLLGNVVRATHGESKQEVLGSGNQTKKNQSFKLSNPPLTYLRSDTARAESTLTVRVNGIEWKEADNFRDLGPDDERYVVERKSDGTTWVHFGDGEHGARLPTGRENVTAEYRSGIGTAGHVSDEQLTILKEKPQGVKQVTNPRPASGGGDPESGQRIRRNAPSETVLVNRIVSLHDYEVFAETSPGIAKADASLMRHHDRRLIGVTVAGEGKNPSNATLKETDLENMRSGMLKSSDGETDVRIEPFINQSFGIRAEILVHSRHRFEDVQERVNNRLTTTYSFQNSQFGNQIREPELITIIQNTDGVKATRLLKFGLLEPKEGTFQYVEPDGDSSSTSQVTRNRVVLEALPIHEVEDETAGETESTLENAFLYLNPLPSKMNDDGEMQPAPLIWLQPEMIEISEMTDDR